MGFQHWLLRPLLVAEWVVCGCWGFPIKFYGGVFGFSACRPLFWLAVRLLLGGSLLSSPVFCLCGRVLIQWGVAVCVFIFVCMFGMCMLSGEYWWCGSVIVCRMSNLSLICYKL